MEELEETMISLHCGDSTYLARTAATVSNLVALDSDVDFTALDEGQLSELYQLGEWWREDRATLPGVAQLLRSIRQGEVKYVTYSWGSAFYLECCGAMGSEEPSVQTAGGRRPRPPGAAPQSKCYDRLEDILADARLYSNRVAISQLPKSLLELVPPVEQSLIEILSINVQRIGASLNFVSIDATTGESTYLVSPDTLAQEDRVLLFCPRALPFQALPGGIKSPPQHGYQDVMSGEIPQSVMLLALLTRTFPERVSRAAWVAWADDLSDVTADELASFAYGTLKTKFSARQRRSPVFMFGSRPAIEGLRSMASAR